MRHIARLALVAVSMLLACSQRDRARGHDSSKPVSAHSERHTAKTASQPYVASEQRIVLDQVMLYVVDSDERPSIELYPRILGQELGRLLLMSPMFVADVSLVEDGYRPRRAEVHVQIEYGLSSGMTTDDQLIAFSADGRIVWEDGEGDLAPTSSLAFETVVDVKMQQDLAGFVAELASHAVARLGHDLIAKEQIRTGGRQALRDGLQSEDVALVAWSLELVTAYGARDMFELALSALSSDDIPIRDHAVRALIAIGDVRAVDALAKRASFDDHAFVRQVIDAVVELGGADAGPYLEFIASGHLDAEIRARAASGLRQLQRKPSSDS